ncbi:MAG: AAA family ATPase [Nannocystaceae bacterium]|nr:AAA family ATPase [Nannocystaceae bacterium]
MSTPAKTIGSQLAWSCTAAELEHLGDGDGVVVGRLGQERALEALALGLAMRYPDYHVFALGPAGVGKHATVLGVIQARAAAEAVPHDVCYVHCFDDERHPRLLRVAAGRGAQLREGVQAFVRALASAIPEALARKDTRSRRAAIAGALEARREQAVAAVRQQAAAQEIALVATPNGFALAPVVDGEPLAPEQFAALPPAQREALAATMQALERQLATALFEAPQWIRQAREQSRALDRAVIAAEVADAMTPLASRWADVPEVRQWLEALARDVIEHADALVVGDDDEDDETPSAMARRHIDEGRRRRYVVNVVVDRTGARGAPVAYVDHPTLDNLVGRIEARLDADDPSMDVSLVVAGALQRANGGYLVVDASKILAQPASWSALKRALFAREVRIDSVAPELGFGRAVTLDPQPVTLDLKCVLIGDRLHYELLRASDPEFTQLFKVVAEFEPDVVRTTSSVAAFARMAANMAADARLRPLAAEAMAALVDDAARRTGDARRLSLDLQALSQRLREADHFAARQDATTIAAEHVAAARAAQWRRNAATPERMREQLRDGTLHIATTGAVVGQVNALAVLSLGEIDFAQPTRVTARVRPGRNELVDISRESRIGGPIHSKGVLTLAGFLAGRYFGEGLLALSASLVFEQSYGPIEGDSASLAELCALVSAIAELPARQGVAITGAIDQLGNVQAVGAVDDKVEGFFEACALTQFDGSQGVIVPRVCLSQLMLRADVIKAVDDGRFAVWAVDRVDEALAILLGRDAGERDADGRFPPDSINARVEHRLTSFAAALRSS